MSQTTIQLLMLAIRAQGEDRKKVLPYLRRAVSELQILIQRIEEET